METAAVQGRAWHAREIHPAGEERQRRLRHRRGAVTLETAFAAFLKEYPQYAHTADLDALRASDYGRLDDTDQIYLDYTGGGLHAASQVQAHADVLNAHVFSNPHSANLTSAATTDL